MVTDAQLGPGTVSSPPTAARDRSPSERGLGVTCLHAVILLAWVIVLVAPSCFLHGGSDFGNYFNNARLIAQGRVPYSDFWYHKTPLLFYYLAVWVGLFGPTWWTSMAAMASIYYLSSLMAYALHRRVFGGKWTALWTGLLTAYLALNLATDMPRNGAVVAFAVALESASLCALWAASDRGRERGRRVAGLSAASGALAVLGALARQSSVVPFVVVLLWLTGRRSSKVARTALWFMAGAAGLAVIAGLLWLMQGMSWAEFVDQNLRFNLIYRRFYARLGAGRLLRSMDVPFVLWAAAGVGLLCLFRTERGASPSFRRRWLFTLLAVAVALGFRVYSGKPIQYYNLGFTSYLAMLSMASIHQACREVTRWLPRGGRAILAVLAALAAISLHGHVRAQITRLGQMRRTLARRGFCVEELPDVRIARRVRELMVRGDDTVFVYGNHSWIYTLTGRNAPTRFTYNSGFMFRGYRTPKEFNQVLAEFKAAPPRVIVRWWSARHKVFLAAYLDAFEREVLSHYEVADELRFDDVDVWPNRAGKRPIVIYVRKAGAGPLPPTGTGGERGT